MESKTKYTTPKEQYLFDTFLKMLVQEANADTVLTLNIEIPNPFTYQPFGDAIMHHLQHDDIYCPSYTLSAYIESDGVCDCTWHPVEPISLSRVLYLFGLLIDEIEYESNNIHVNVHRDPDRRSIRYDDWSGGVFMDMVLPLSISYNMTLRRFGETLRESHDTVEALVFSRVLQPMLDSTDSAIYKALVFSRVLQPMLDSTDSAIYKALYDKYAKTSL